MAISPTFLAAGDTILVVSPSGKADPVLLKKGCDYLLEEGFQLEIGKYAYSHHYKFAGTHEQRLEDLQWALDHSTAKAIFCARGGYGVTYLLDQLDWSLFKNNPKWVIGYSDITALHQSLYHHNYCSVHASVLQSMLEQDDSAVLLSLLQGNYPDISFPSMAHDRIGEVISDILGGNLAMLINQLGTATEPVFEGKILFLEEVGEYLYHIDRMFLQLKRTGMLGKLGGLIIGNFSQLLENKEVFGQNVIDIVTAHCKEYNFPIAFNFPLGHENRNWPVVHGAKVSFVVRKREVMVSYL
jgi:muramoyltetrapeptide carboxypeptidase